MNALAQRFPTLSRHFAILRESWRNQNEADNAFRPHSDHSFLPAALEIIERPPSPGLRWLLLSLCSLFVITLGWTILGKVDVVAVAAGKTVPSGSAKIIQPMELGTVRAIHVTNGQFVRRGQLLIELDPTLAAADEAQSDQTLRSAQLLKARNDALLGYLNSGTFKYTPPGGASVDTATEQQLVRSTIAEHEAQRASLVQQRAGKMAELAGARAEMAKLEESLPYIEQQLGARAELAAKGYYSKLKLLEYEQLHAEQRRTLDVRRSEAARAQAAIAGIDAQIAQLRQNFTRTAAGSLAEANEKAGIAGEEGRKSERRREYQQLRAPVDGVVQQLAVTTIGGVVQPAQPLMVIVPCTALGTSRPDPNRCTSAVEVEAFVQNKDVGFVRAGQRVAVKLEAFNFTDHGLIDGVVESVSRDAVDRGSNNEQSNGAAPPAALAYLARVRLLCGSNQRSRSHLCDRVQPGMAAQAEIKTGRRRIIKYLLSPLAKTAGETGRER